jgi:hypothetical protein
MTNREDELVAALEADNQTWEFVAGIFERHVNEIDLFDGKKMSGRNYAGVLRKRISENRTLVEKLKHG